MAEYKLTEQGKKECKIYINELKAKRKEILDARLDTADETEIPTIDDIVSDLSYGAGADEDSNYYNNWGVTDNYNGDYPLRLELGKDFVECR